MTAKKRSKPAGKDAHGKQDERVSLAPLNPVEALKGLLAVDPSSKPQKSPKRPRKG